MLTEKKMLPSHPPTIKEKTIATGLSTESKPVPSYHLPRLALYFKTISRNFSTF